MDTRRCTAQRLRLLGIAGFAVAVLAGCSGDDGAAGPAGATSVQTIAASSTTALNITVTGVTVASPPVVNFRVTDQYGTPATGLRLGTDLRFTIAKLVPGTIGNPSFWQSYVNTVSGGRVQATTDQTGTLADHNDGTYKYTFATDITNASCPAPCTDSYGNPLNVSYNAGLTHRVGIQTRTTVPIANAVYTFRPADGATSGLFSREIVKTEKCNECHNKLAVHSSARVDTRFCVTCHNPGTTANGTVGSVTGNTPVDFKVMIHKIHMGEALPSVKGADGVFGTADDGSYQLIGGSGTVHDYTTVVFPQDARNCTKCHDATAGATNATGQGDNWKTQPSKEACGSCHDDVNFATGANHPGGAQTSNSTCLGCHSTGGAAGAVETSHVIAAKVAGAKYKLNLISVTGGATPVIQFSVTDPTNADAPYDIASGTATTNPKFKTPSTSRLAITIGWNTADFASDTSGTNPAQPISIDPVNACDGTPIADWTCTAAANVYTLTKSTTLPAAATGTGRVGFEGHPAAQDATGAWTVRVPVKNVYKDFAISGTLTARRQVVDIAKCDKCHDQLSLHGNNRTDEPQVCVVCHNPNDTDVNRRPKTAGGIPDTAAARDGKKMESIDFKVMIHAIHAGAKTDYSGVAAHGFREKGIVVYGFGSVAVDFSHVRFPGVLKDCSACHANTTTTSGIGTYELTSIWELPTQSGILATTVDAAPTAVDAATLATQLADQTDDLNVSPTAAVCSSCHDSTLSKSHMAVNGAIGVGSVPAATQATISAGGTLESCALCHAPGKVADVKTMHGIK